MRENAVIRDGAPFLTGKIISGNWQVRLSQTVIFSFFLWFREKYLEFIDLGKSICQCRPVHDNDKVDLDNLRFCFKEVPFEPNLYMNMDIELYDKLARLPMKAFPW